MTGHSSRQHSVQPWEQKVHNSGILLVSHWVPLSTGIHRLWKCSAVPSALYTPHCQQAANFTSNRICCPRTRRQWWTLWYLCSRCIQSGQGSWMWIIQGHQGVSQEILTNWFLTVSFKVTNNGESMPAEYLGLINTMTMKESGHRPKAADAFVSVQNMLDNILPQTL